MSAIKQGVLIVCLVVCLSVGVLAQGSNLGFEEGNLTPWETRYFSGGQNYNANLSSTWSSEGNYSAKIPGFGASFLLLNFHYALINNTQVMINPTDMVCLDYKFEKTGGGGLNLFSSVAGTFFASAPAGEKYDVCATSQQMGHLDIRMTGIQNSCAGCSGKIWIDNVRVFRCDDSIKNGDEADIDCAGRCKRCDNGASCSLHKDCLSLYCGNGTCSDAPSFAHHFNLNFEQGINGNYSMSQTTNGDSFAVGDSWVSEGKYGIGMTEHIASTNSVTRSFFTSNVTIIKGDSICMDIKKNESNDPSFKVVLETNGTVMESVASGIHKEKCAQSLGSGSLGVKVQGTEAGSCRFGDCTARFFIDNITINIANCTNGAFNRMESDVDCGGFCPGCVSGKNCREGYDCKSRNCTANVCILPQSCANNVADVNEEGVDCGGLCDPCVPLLEKYAPVMYFHPDEEFFPTTIYAMLNESDLKHKVTLGTDPIDDEMPVDVGSLEGRDDTFYLDMRGASAGVTATTPNASRFDKYPRAIYGREVNDSGFTVLQYWFFYAFNDFRGGHEGDWEMIQLLLNQTTQKPLFATYSFHYDAATYNWSEVQKVDSTHPKVFVALGGHASYVKNESSWHLRPYTLESVASEGESAIVKNLEIRKLEGWVNYIGMWGEWDFGGSKFNGPNSPANIAYEGQVNRWNHPVDFAWNTRANLTTGETGSPVNLHAYDSQGRHVGLNSSGGIDMQIPGVYLYANSTDGKEAIVILSNDDITFVINATGEGAFNLTITRYDSSTGKELNITYQDVSITNSTVAVMNLTTTSQSYTMSLDMDGDGNTDSSQSPSSVVSINNGSVDLDSDNDGFSDSLDNCPNWGNPSQIKDVDGDGYNTNQCGGNDCNDGSSSINPGKEEICNSIDDNCDGAVDPACSSRSSGGGSAPVTKSEEEVKKEEKAQEIPKEVIRMKDTPILPKEKMGDILEVKKKETPKELFERCQKEFVSINTECFSQIFIKKNETEKNKQNLITGNSIRTEENSSIGEDISNLARKMVEWFGSLFSA